MLENIEKRLEQGILKKVPGENEQKWFTDVCYRQNMDAQNTSRTEKGKVPYVFESKVWKHNSPVAWYFASVPECISEEIRTLFQKWEEGWGRLKCKAQIGNTRWETAIWYDTHHQAYILPLKAEIRKKEHIEIDQTISINLRI